ncbi:MAG: ferric reductase-like transmembrane domain-containing protein [Deltaproteobacteria bacterium]|jgi:DMSO/TMAO reductase YedYZ heme-binding membrane subunit|nr:ferric reductase-like transmembrane domain-containing protein [Deltaproteobacteria bacterium]
MRRWMISLLALALLILGVWIGRAEPTLGWVPAVRGSGILAAVFLGLSLACTPVGRVLGRSVSAWRRSFGLIAAGLALLHGVGAAATPLVPQLRLLWYEPLLRAGAITLGLLLALGLSSFPRRWSPRHWKALHQLVWAAVLALLGHVALSPHASSVELGLMAAVVVVLLLARAWPGLGRCHRPQDQGSS